MQSIVSIKVLTVDFWNTLYHHRGTPDFRKTVRNQRLLEHCRLEGSTDPEQISGSFFDVINSFIKRRWSMGFSTSKKEIIQHAEQTYSDDCSQEFLERLLTKLYEIYLTDLRPVPFPGALEFIDRTSSRWPLYLISDTYTLPGLVLDAILEHDGCRRHFAGTLYSDRIGTQKPDTSALDEVARCESCTASRIVHIGDLVERDYKLAEQSGAHCVLLRHSAEWKEKEETNPEVLLGICRDFTEVESLLKSYDQP